MTRKDFPARLAALDVGSHTIRCLVVEPDGRGSYRVLADEERTTRTAAALAAADVPGALRASAAALTELEGVMEGLGVARIEAVATGLFRSAPGGDDLLAALESEGKCEIRRIDRAEEAALAARSARRHAVGLEYPLLAADIGGASVELAVMTDAKRETFHFLDLGAALLTRRFFGARPRTGKAFRALRGHIDDALRKLPPTGGPPVTALVGSGGTFAALAEMTGRPAGPDIGGGVGVEVAGREVERALCTLRHRERRELSALPGIGEGRADIILAGVAVAEGLMRRFGAARLRFNRGGVAEGVILKLLEE